MRPLNRKFAYVLLLFAALAVSPSFVNAQSVVYSTFGPGMTFNFGTAYPIFPPTFPFGEPVPHEIAASFVPSDNVQLSKIDIAVVYNVGDGVIDSLARNAGAVVELLTDAGGQPGTVLETWTVAGPLPLLGNPSAPLQALTATSSIQLISGNRYWVEVMQVGLNGFVDWSESLSANGTFLDSEDGSTWTVDSSSTILPAFDVVGGPLSAANFEYMGVGVGQTIRVTAVASGATSAVLSFLDSNGNAVGTSRTVALSAGQAQSLDFRSTFSSRTEILPVVSPTLGNATFSATVKASAEVWDDLLAIGTVFAPGIASYPNAPTFTPQGLAGAQIFRLTVFSVPSSPCAANLSFEDANGNPLGATKLVNLTGGQSASLDLPASAASVRIGQRIEVQPMVTLSSMGSGGAQSVCPASVEAFDILTGRTETFQMGSAE
jgi:hypothetical protein